MIFQKGKNFWLLLPCILMMVSLRGVSNTPITTKIINDVSAQNHEPEDFQCYLSKTIILKFVDDKDGKPPTIENGQLRRNNLTAREQITIPGKIPGVVLSHEKRPSTGGYQLEVAFENYTRSPSILFGQYYEGNNEKYFLLFQDAEKNIIQYGIYRYVVSYEGEEEPYLMIKTKEGYKKTSKDRRVNGLKLDQ